MGFSGMMGRRLVVVVGLRNRSERTEDPQSLDEVVLNPYVRFMCDVVQHAVDVQEEDAAIGLHCGAQGRVEVNHP